MDASRRGDDRRQEGVTKALSRVAFPIFINLHLSPLIEREIKVLMAQGAIQRGVVSCVTPAEKKTFMMMMMMFITITARD